MALWWLVGALASCGGDDGAGQSFGGSTGADLETTADAEASSSGDTGPGAETNPSNDAPGGDDNGPKCSGEITPDELPTGTVGEMYSVTIQHGVPASTGSVDLIGALPPGLTASDQPGKILLAGTPEVGGEFPLTVVSYTGDGGTCLPEKEYTLVIDGDAATSEDSTEGSSEGSSGGSSGDSATTGG